MQIDFIDHAALKLCVFQLMTIDIGDAVNDAVGFAERLNGMRFDGTGFPTRRPHGRLDSDAILLNQIVGARRNHQHGKA